MPFSDKTRRIVEVALANTAARNELLASVFQQDEIDIIGKGQGPNKTDTNVHGITVTEDFGVGDELFLHWQVPQRMDDTQEVELHMEWAPVTAEVGKTFSIQINISSQGEGTDISDTGTAYLEEDITIPDTAFESFSVTFKVPASVFENGYDDLHLRIKRIASSNDLAGDVALHHVSMEYFIHQT